MLKQRKKRLFITQHPLCLWPMMFILAACRVHETADSPPTGRRGIATVFRDEQTIFTSSFNITRILVLADWKHVILSESLNSPAIFFTASDPSYVGGSCIYVLEASAVFEVLDGGRDTTADYHPDAIYIGAHDGVHKFDAESLTSEKFGPHTDNVIQIQKANGTDRIYTLTVDGRLYLLENNGTTRRKVENVVCAIQFVLDSSNNIYFVQCGDKTIHIIKENGILIRTIEMHDFFDVKLLRPAFIMINCIPFFGNGRLHVLYSNGSSEAKDLRIDNATAFSIDASIYFVTAIDGKLYKYDVMDIMMHSMFRKSLPNHITDMILPFMDIAKDDILGLHKRLRKHEMK